MFSSLRFITAQEDNDDNGGSWKRTEKSKEDRLIFYLDIRGKRPTFT